MQFKFKLDNCLTNVSASLLVTGETVEEQRKKTQTINVTQPSTNVIVQSSKVSLMLFLALKIVCPPGFRPAVSSQYVDYLEDGLMIFGA